MLLLITSQCPPVIRGLVEIIRACDTSQGTTLLLALRWRDHILEILCIHYAWSEGTRLEHFKTIVWLPHAHDLIAAHRSPCMMRAEHPMIDIHLTNTILDFNSLTGQ